MRELDFESLGFGRPEGHSTRDCDRHQSDTYAPMQDRDNSDETIEGDYQ